VQTNKSGQYQLRDLYSEELFVSSDGIFRNITIGPGRGRAFELRQMFVNNETWANTINVSSNINVPSGKILTIAANSTVKFYSGKELKISGTLNAEGVKFTSAADGIHPGYWSKIFFDNANNSSFIRSSTIENAVYGVHCDSCSPTIGAINKPNTIQYNSGNGIKCKYVGQTMTINYNTIQHNGIGIYCEQQSHPYINDNYITDNNSYGIFCTQTCNPYIRHNEVSDNSNGGIACLNYSSPQLIGKSRWDKYGANVIIANSGNGVLAQSNSAPNLGSQSSGDYMGYNSIYSNTTKQVYNGTSTSIQAKQNYWGSATPDSIQLFTGKVIFKPYRTTAYTEAGPTWGISEKSAPLLADDRIYVNDIEALLEKTLTLEGEENYEDAVTVYRQVVDNYGNSEYGAFALARLMACRVNQGDITIETDYLAALTQKHEVNAVGSSALLWQPLVAARAKNAQLSLGLCDNLMKTYTGMTLARDAHFEKATIQLYEFNDIEAAKQTFDEFTRAYPEDPLVEHIKIILDNYTQPLAKLPKQMAQETLPMHNIPIPEKYALAQNSPNPFNPATEIRYQLPENCQVSLVVYNLLGQQIRTLVDKQQPAGFHSARWDGKDDLGQAVASGLYLYVMNAKQFRQVEKMLLLQ
jgi:tetratricopeptide (TPR) repeat protein